MRKLIAAAGLAVIGSSPLAYAEPSHVYFLRFSEADATSLGQIDRLEVAVACSWVTALANVPELYNIESGYEIPLENRFRATPRLGSAAVDLLHWNGVIGVRVPASSDAKSCFAVTVTAKGRSGISKQWSGHQLGLPK